MCDTKNEKRNIRSNKVSEKQVTPFSAQPSAHLYPTNWILQFAVVAVLTAHHLMHMHSVCQLCHFAKANLNFITKTRTQPVYHYTGITPYMLS